jgi:hypothetical protein
MAMTHASCRPSTYRKSGGKSLRNVSSVEPTLPKTIWPSTTARPIRPPGFTLRAMADSCTCCPRTRLVPVPPEVVRSPRTASSGNSLLTWAPMAPSPIVEMLSKDALLSEPS